MEGALAAIGSSVEWGEANRLWPRGKGGASHKLFKEGEQRAISFSIKKVDSWFRKSRSSKKGKVKGQKSRPQA